MIEWNFLRVINVGVRGLRVPRWLLFAAADEPVRKGGDAIMRQVVRVLAVFTIGCFLLLVPVAGTGIATPVVPATVVVSDRSLSALPPSARSAPPTGEQPTAPELPLPGSSQSPQGPLIDDRNFAVGAAGVVLIVLVLLVRKLRGKTYFGLSWRKRG